ncbi:MAG: hypothetical protein ACLFN8_00940 [Candidatus Woesearchaeota archaeon]
MDDENLKITIESKIVMINEFRQHLFRSLDVRTSVSSDLIEGAKLLSEDVSSEEGLRLLRRAHKNEGPYLDLVRKGLDKTISYLDELSGWIKVRSGNSALFNNIGRLFEFHNLFNSLMDKSFKRFNAQELFLKTELESDFYKFMTSWAYNVEEARALLAACKDVREIDSYFKDLAGNVRLALRAGFGSDNFFEIANSWQVKFEDYDEFMAFFSYSLLLNSISLMFLTFSELEEQIESVNIINLEKVGVSLN